MPQDQTRDFDVIVYGATGFTGRLVAEYLVGKRTPRWAMAGRSLTKLEEVRDLIGAPADTPLVVADADDPATLATMCARTRVVLTTVGPYQLYGTALVAACAASGTGYVDLCGEPAWMRHMIDAHHDEAKRTGARIVFSCGFDSIPFDLGVLTLQECALAKFGRPAPRVKGRVRQMQGGFSGGTAASLKATLAAAARDPSLVKLLTSSFALTPGFKGAHQPTGLIPEYDSTIGAWVAPFVMAPINTKNVHRTNFLLGNRYGDDFVYDEMMVAPGLGEIGKAAADAIAKYNPFGSEGGPKPGEGPSKADRDAGHYDILFAGLMPDGTRIDAVVTGDRDPGYGSTSKMIAESALCLVEDVAGDGGIWTPGALMGPELRTRLKAHAGLTFTAG
ncbi:saccharopine dehydrogenase family protein [Sphingomonas oligophenolica]|uniref:Saccharopine dehydrogenase n=1 Tax=Sphingomonas oligophenolica TaxID=301154 RepID=A0A502CJY4_9SPHN|nr:saccharopine dehydrogenase NADP-binding domain-containing protein [Sphingomonas oligophenolica]TPG13527.1 saccharopine dehydrogenase [Sphingomonas oligophenolica]